MTTAKLIRSDIKLVETSNKNYALVEMNRARKESAVPRQKVAPQDITTAGKGEN